MIDAARRAQTDTLSEDAQDSYEAGEFEAAIGDLEKAVEIDPADAGAQLLLAQAYEASGDLAKAETAYLASLQIDPKQPQALYNLAIIHRSQGKSAEAIDELERAVQIDRSFVAARVALGDLYAANGDKPAAREQYEAVLEMKPLGTDLEAIRGKLRGLE